MFKKLNETVTLKDSKGNEYVFDMYAYDTLDAVEEAVKDYKHAGLYIFAKRYIENGKKYFVLSYIGETGDYSTRGYANHHKKQCIELHGSNEFGISLLSVSDAKRLEIETDLINTNTPPCNG